MKKKKRQMSIKIVLTLWITKMISGTCSPKILWSNIEKHTTRLILSDRCNWSDYPEQRDPTWTSLAKHIWQMEVKRPEREKLLKKKAVDSLKKKLVIFNIFQSSVFSYAVPQALQRTGCIWKKKIIRTRKLCF